MTDFVYLISHHGEHGSEEVTATLDRARLPELLAAYFANQKDWQGNPWNNWCANQELSALLAKPDEELEQDGNPHNLTDDWGGVQLHVVRLA